MAQTTTIDRTDTDRQSIALLARELAASGMSALLAGVAVGGVGGRLAMRISAIVNPSMTGRISDAGNRIGSVTPGGTLALVIFGGALIGLAAGVAWVAVRPWLPSRQPWRRAAASIAACGVVGFLVVEAENFDFFILDPAWLHVVMFIGIVAGAGALTEWIDGHLVARWRRSQDFTAGAVLMLLIGAPMAIPLTGVFFSTEFCDCANPPRVAGALLLATLGATAGTWIVRWRGGIAPTWLRMLGWGATAGCVAFGLLYLGSEIVTIV